MERIIQFSPAFDKRNQDPRKNYGIHGVDLLFLLKGPEGAVQFRLFTNWHLPSVVKEHEDDPWGHWQPLPADLGYHSYIPRYEGQEPTSDDCLWLDGKTCYYGGSGLNAEPVYQRFVAEGDKGVWDALEHYYKKTFEVETLT